MDDGNACLRRRLVSSGGWRGAGLAQAATAVARRPVGSFVYRQQVTDGPSGFAWDAVDWLLGSTEAGNSAFSDTLSYDGMTDEVSLDSADTYSRDPSGQITGVDAGGAQVIALDDGHNDLSGTFSASGTSMTSSTSYDPWGQVLAADAAEREAQALVGLAAADEAAAHDVAAF